MTLQDKLGLSTLTLHCSTTCKFILAFSKFSVEIPVAWIWDYLSKVLPRSSAAIVLYIISSFTIFFLLVDRLKVCSSISLHRFRRICASSAVQRNRNQAGCVYGVPEHWHICVPSRSCITPVSSVPRALQQPALLRPSITKQIQQPQSHYVEKVGFCWSWQTRYLQFRDQELDKPKEKQPTLCHW